MSEEPIVSTPSRFARAFGPGLLLAGTAIGVSHLVQSTRAGAEAGLGLVGVLVLALVVKYPLFEFGPRYAAATGESLIEGYRRIGRWTVVLYLVETVLMSFIVDAAVFLFTAVLLVATLGVEWSLPWVAGVLYAGCAAVLAFGRFRLLDLAMKAIAVVLSVSTLAAAALCLPQLDLGTIRWWPADAGELLVPLGFVLAFVGWMPAGLDVAAWSSLWTLAKQEDTGTRASYAHVRADFDLGYAGAAVMAFAFLVLGAGVMYGSGTAFSDSGARFALQLVDLYGRTLGDWARPIVVIAALSTMVSTGLAVVDGFPRAIRRALHVLGSDAAAPPEQRPDRIYWTIVAGIGVAMVIVLTAFVGNLLMLIDLVTTLSFLTAPLLGWLNLRAITSPEVPSEARPGPALRALAWSGLVLLTALGLVYVRSLLV